MLTVNQTSTVRNPFSTRFVRPGAICYQFPAGINTESLVEQLRTQNWRGAIIGPHGSGKSTLLATLIPAIENAGCPVQSIALHDGQKNLPPDFLNPIKNHPLTPSALQPFTHSPPHPLTHSLILIDGYEQLSWWSRRKLLARCRKHDCGLLITAHQDAAAHGLPILYRTATELATVQNLVADLIASSGTAISPDEVAAAFEAHHGNIRETLFALYTLFEHRRRETPV